MWAVTMTDEELLRLKKEESKAGQLI